MCRPARRPAVADRERAGVAERSHRPRAYPVVAISQDRNLRRPGKPATSRPRRRSWLTKGTVECGAKQGSQHADGAAFGRHLGRQFRRTLDRYLRPGWWAFNTLIVTNQAIDQGQLCAGAAPGWRHFLRGAKIASRLACRYLYLRLAKEIICPSQDVAFNLTPLPQ